MTKQEWHEKYMVRLMRKADFTRREAKDTLKAGMGEHDYDDDPKDAADEEMSYWTDDA